MFAAALFAALISAPGAEAASHITWIHDDWEAAKKQAVAEKKPIAIDVWATWCHTCLSMQRYVFTDKALAPMAPKYVWLALDFDLPKNAAFFERFPITAFPTFLVIDASNDAVLGRWLGSGTASEMLAFYTRSTASGEDVLRESQRALAREDYAEAKKLAEAKLADPKLDPATRTRLLLGWVEALWKFNQHDCALVGVKHLGELDQSTQALDFASFVAGCSEELEPKDKQAVLTAVRDHLQPKLKKHPKVADDDLSGLYATMVDVYEGLGDKKSADATATARLALLEAATKRAKSAEERAVFDDHRLDLYLRFGRWAEAEKMLQASEAAQPKDFNHPWRLAKVMLAQKKLDPGLAAIDRALANGYGGRKLRLYTTKIDLLLEAKRSDDARATLAAARAEIQKLPPSVVRKSWVDELESRAKKIEDAAPKG